RIAVRTQDNKPLKFDTDLIDYGVGVSVDLPLDRLQERNTYRASLIANQQATRDLAELEDVVKQEVREDLRTVRHAAEDYEIQKASVALARNRVDSTSMLLDAGRASTRDLLDAQDSLIQAENALSRAAVDYKIAQLELLRDMETLQMPEQGLTYVD